MKHRHFTDREVHSAIHSVAGEGRAITTHAVRIWLRQHHGHPGGVDHISRIVTGYRLKQVPLTEAPVKEIETLKAQLAEAQKRAELAEHRSEVDSARWMVEIDTLRQIVKRVAPLERQLAQVQQSYLNAQQKISMLERRLAGLDPLDDN